MKILSEKTYINYKNATILTDYHSFVIVSIIETFIQTFVCRDKNLIIKVVQIFRNAYLLVFQYRSLNRTVYIIRKENHKNE